VNIKQTCQLIIGFHCINDTMVAEEPVRFDVLLEISSFIEANLLWSLSSRLVVFAILMFLALLFRIGWLQ
jgi:hypothetical protein